MHDVDVSIAEQYRRLTNAPPEDPLVGRDLLVRVDIDEHLVVAATWREGMWMSGIARGTGPSEFVLIGAGLTELCRDPQVVAGAMPRGATRARVQDRQDVWHEATVGRSAWLYVLPQRSRDGVNPPLEFLDTKGAPVELGEDAWGFGQPPDPGSTKRRCGPVPSSRRSSSPPTTEFRSSRAGTARAIERPRSTLSSAAGT